MIAGANEEGAAFARRPFGVTRPDKASVPKSVSPACLSANFNVLGAIRKVRGKRLALVRRAMAAGEAGVTRAEFVLALPNLPDAIAALKLRGFPFRTVRGQPTRWILDGNVREVP